MNRTNPTSRARRPSPPWLRASMVAALLAGGAALAQDPAVEPKPESTPPPAADEKDPSDLGERLVRKAVNEADEDVMSEILRLMGESSRRLDAEFDAGDETQAVQKRVMERLDEAIKQAASQLRKQKSSPREKSQDKRKQESGSKEQQERRQQERNQATPSPEDSSADQRGEVAETKLPGGELQESRRAWGLLPLRDRDEVIQGKNEQYLDRYRLLIEQYFRALQGAEEEQP